MLSGIYLRCFKHQAVSIALFCLTKCKQHLHSNKSLLREKVAGSIQILYRTSQHGPRCNNPSFLWQHRGPELPVVWLQRVQQILGLKCTLFATLEAENRRLFFFFRHRHCLGLGKLSRQQTQCQQLRPAGRRHAVGVAPTLLASLTDEFYAELFV